MKIIEEKPKKQNKIPNNTYVIEMNTKEMVIVASLLGRSICRDKIISNMYKSIKSFGYRGWENCEGFVQLDGLVEHLNKVYKD